MDAFPTVARTVRLRSSTAVVGLAGVASILVVLELVAATGLVSARYVPPPSRLGPALVTLMGDPAFSTAIRSTAGAWLAAIAIVFVVGVTIGIAMGMFETLRLAAAGLVEFLRPIPSVGLLPAAVLLFGLGTTTKVLLACYAALWPVLINAIYGVSNVDKMLLYSAATFRWSRWAIFRRVVLRSAAPFIATGLRVAAAVALIVVLTTEILVARSGLGTLIRIYQEAGRIEMVYAGIAITGVLGLTSNTLLSLVERRVLHWDPANRGSA